MAPFIGKERWWNLEYITFGSVREDSSSSESIATASLSRLRQRSIKAPSSRNVKYVFGIAFEKMGGIMRHKSYPFSCLLCSILFYDTIKRRIGKISRWIINIYFALTSKFYVTLWTRFRVKTDICQSFIFISLQPQRSACCVYRITFAEEPLSFRACKLLWKSRFPYAAPSGQGEMYLKSDILCSKKRVLLSTLYRIIEVMGKYSTHFMSPN